MSPVIAQFYPVSAASVQASIVLGFATFWETCVIGSRTPPNRPMKSPCGFITD
jgi:hypothetical protein